MLIYKNIIIHFIKFVNKKFGDAAYLADFIKHFI